MASIKNFAINATTLSIENIFIDCKLYKIKRNNISNSEYKYDDENIKSAC